MLSEKGTSGVPGSASSMLVCELYFRIRAKWQPHEYLNRPSPTEQEAASRGTKFPKIARCHNVTLFSLYFI